MRGNAFNSYFKINIFISFFMHSVYYFNHSLTYVKVMIKCLSLVFMFSVQVSKMMFSKCYGLLCQERDDGKTKTSKSTSVSRQRFFKDRGRDLFGSLLVLH